MFLPDTLALLGEKGWPPMTAMINGMAKSQWAVGGAAVELTRMAKKQGLRLTDRDGLLRQVTRVV